MVDFDDSFINDPVDNDDPSLLISIADPSSRLFASIDTSLPLRTSFVSIRNIPLVTLVDFDDSFINDPVTRSSPVICIPVPSVKCSADMASKVPPVCCDPSTYKSFPPSRLSMHVSMPAD